MKESIYEPNERKELIFKYINFKLSLMSADDLRAFYVENMTDWLDTWDTEELLEILPEAA
jgi:hypothetical protein